MECKFEKEYNYFHFYYNLIACVLIDIFLSINSDKNNQFKLSRALGLTVPS